MATIVPITNQCNQNCLFCAAKGRDDNVNLDGIYRCIDQEKSLVVISGGEPTLSRDLFTILRYAKNRSLNIELQTNGATLSYFDLAKKLAEAKIDLFNINFPSHLEKLTDKITRTTNFFKERVKGVKNLQELGANIRITHVVNSLTYEYLCEFVEYVKKQFKSINYIQFSFIKILGSARKNPHTIPKYENVKGPLLKALRKCQKYKINFLVDHIPTCYLPGFEDSHADFRKLKNSGTAEFSLKEKSKIAQCRRCKLKKYCYGVRKDYVELFEEKNAKVIPYFK